MTTQEMIEALSVSTNANVNKIANDIIAGRDTIDRQKTICGKFLQHVFDGKHLDAFRVADNCNKHALIRWLLEKDRQDDADYLIKHTYFNYRDSESQDTG